MNIISNKIINIASIFVLFLLLAVSLSSAYHDSVPAGQHVMPNGQLMNNADMMSSNEKAKSSILFILLFVAVIGIALWWVMRSNKNVN